MTEVDEYLRNKRMRVVAAHLKHGAEVLDIGCLDGAFFRLVQGKIQKGVGLDPLAPSFKKANIELRKFKFTKKLPFPDRSFTDVVMLATFEHIPDKHKAALVSEIHRVLKPRGKFMMTIPSPSADSIINLLMQLRILGEKDFFEQHETPSHQDILSMFYKQKFQLHIHEIFQMGFNNLYIFTKR